MNNKGHGGELMRGFAGEEVFCREGCESYSTCDHQKRRVLQCNTDIIEFASEIASGFNYYVWEGNYQNQPIWWYDLLKKCQGYIAEIRNDNGK